MSRNRILAAASLCDAQPGAALNLLLEEVAELRCRCRAVARAATVVDVLRASPEPLTTREVARELNIPPTRARTKLLEAHALGTVRRCGEGAATVWTPRRAAIGGAA